LRIDQPYGWIEKWQKFNNVIRVLNILNSGQLLKDVVDWYNNPTLLTDIGDVTKILIEKNKNGIYNVVGPDFINRYEWALMIAEIFHKNKKQILPIKEEELNLPAKRGKVNLSNEKVFIDTGIKMRSVREGLEYMMQEQGNVI
jgi:dTDP-4-dehydrorhamnose reductase